MNKIILLLMFFIVLSPILFAQAAEAADVTKAWLLSDIPIYEKIIIGFFLLFTVSVVIFIWKGMPRLLDQREKKLIQNHEIALKNTESIEAETNAIVKEIGNRLTIIEDVITKHEKYLETLSNKIIKIEKDSEKYTDYDTFNNKYRNVEKLLLKGIIYNENIPVIERLEAFDDYLKLKGNHNAYNYAMKLIVNNKETWLSVQHNSNKDFVLDKEYYNNAINNIKRMLM
jgi:hypothetical protein